MSKINVVIIEDEFFVAHQLSDLITNLGCAVTGIYHSGELFLEETDWKFDVAVVDIFLSDALTGLDVGKELSKRNLPFLFLTANQDERTLRGAAVLRPRAYLTKPFQKTDVIAAFEIIRAGLTPNMEVRTNNGIEELNPNTIHYIKGDGGYIEIYCDRGKIVQRKLLKDILNELPDGFIRVHRSFVVNPLFIESKSATNIVVKGEKIPVSRGLKDVIA